MSWVDDPNPIGDDAATVVRLGEGGCETKTPSGTLNVVAEPAIAAIGATFPFAPGANSRTAGPIVAAESVTYIFPEASTARSSGLPKSVFDPRMFWIGATLPFEPAPKTSRLLIPEPNPLVT